LYFSNGNGTFQSIDLEQTDPNGIGNRGFPEHEDDGDLRTVHIPGDFNGDGKTDVLKWPKDGNYNYLMLSNGDGTFQRIILATQDSQGIGSMVWFYGDDCITSHLPGDYNGDGLTDVLMWKSNGESHLFLSKGDGTFQKITSPAGIGTMTWLDSDGEQQPRTIFIPADFNGDAKTDVLKWQYDGNNHLFLSKGDGTFYAIANPPAIGNMTWTREGKTAHLHGDFNGDGKEDVFKWQTNGINRLFMWGYTEPLFCLESIDNGQGGKTTFSYQPSSIYENTYLPFVMPTVSSITTEDGLGNSSTVNYYYKYGLFNVPEREFWGFGLVSQTTPDNNTTYTWFRQDDLYYRGKQYQVEVRNSNNPPENFLSKTTFFWEKVPLYNNSQFVELTQKVTEGDGVDGTPDTYAFFSQEDYTYDSATGNPLSVQTAGTDGETITAYSEWTNYGTWVWRKTKETLKNSSNQQVRQTTMTYQTTTGNMLSKTSWLQGGTNPQVTMTYDAYGNPITATDARGNTTTTTYDTPTKTYAITQTLPTTNGVSHVLQNQYDLRFGKVITATDENSNSTTTTLDKFGRPIQADRTDGGRAITQYYNYASSTSPQYVITKVKEDATHTIDAYTYFDGLGRKSQTISFGEDGQSIVSRLYYDQMGRNYLTKGPFFSTGTGYPKTPPSICPWSQTFFDDHSRPEEVRTQDSTLGVISAYYAYDGLSTTITDPDGGKKTEKKNYLGKLIQVTEYNQENGSWVQYLTNYTYNAAGDMLTVTNHYGNVTTINYDTLGRKTSMTDPDMGTWHYTYDAGGNLLTQTDAVIGQDQQNHQSINFTYDALNRVLTKTYTNSLNPQKNPAVTYTYDNLSISNGRGRLYSVANANSTTTITAYDTMGRTLSSSKTITGSLLQAITQYTYDLAGKTLTMTYPDTYRVNYLYYAGSGLLWKVVGNSDSREYARLEDYEPSGKTSKLYQEGGSVVTTNTYDGYSGRLLSLKTENPNILQYKQYSYTPAGDISQIIDNVKSVTHTYAYDKLHRLIGEAGTDTYNNLTPAILSNTYDTQNGPIHAVAETTINLVDYSYVYDANGNLTQGPDFTDMNNIGTRTIEYNVDNKPYHVEHSGGGIAMDLLYDGNGGRVKKEVAQGSTTYYFGDHYEIKDGDATKYIFAGNLRIAQIVGANNDSPEYFHKDHLGSSSVMTNDQGAVVESTDYLPFGETRSHTGTEVSNYKFTDQELDPESGLYNYDARMYDPVTGLFVTADIMVQNFSNPQTLNRYAYCGNNPLAYVDPDGHGFWAAVGVIVGAMIGTAAAFSAINSLYAVITGGDVGQAAMTGAITGAFIGGAGGIIGLSGITSKIIQAGIYAAAGAAGGATASAATGGDVGMGALTGGIGGGIIGYFGTPNFITWQNNKWWGAMLDETINTSLTGGIMGAVNAGVTGNDPLEGFTEGAKDVGNWISRQSTYWACCRIRWFRI